MRIAPRSRRTGSTRTAPRRRVAARPRCAAGSTAGTRSTRTASTPSSRTCSPRSSHSGPRVDVEHAEHIPRPGPALLVVQPGLGLVEPLALTVAVRREARPPPARRRRPRLPARSATCSTSSAGSARTTTTSPRCCGPATSPPCRSARPGCARGAGDAAARAARGRARAIPVIPVAVPPGGPLGLPIRPWRVVGGRSTSLPSPGSTWLGRPARGRGARRSRPETGVPRAASSSVAESDCRHAAPGGRVVSARDREHRSRGDVGEGVVVPRSWPTTASRSTTRCAAGATATPLLMIQGLGADSRGWALQRMAFGRRHRCYRHRQPGRRRVGDRPPGPYSLEQMARDAVAVLDAEGVERAHVMGASMGGVIAQIIAVLHPERARSLVLACTACRHHEWRRELLAEWAEEVDAARDVGARRRGAAVARRAAARTAGSGSGSTCSRGIVLQQPPEPFVAQVDAILDATDELRFALEQHRASRRSSSPARRTRSRRSATPRSSPS